MEENITAYSEVPSPRRRRWVLSLLVSVLVTGLLISSALAVFYFKSNPDAYKNIRSKIRSPIVGVVGKDVIWRKEVTKAVKKELEVQRSLGLLPEDTYELEMELEKRFVEDQVIAKKASEAGVSASMSEIDSKYENLVTQTGGKDEFQRYLDLSGNTKAYVKEEIAKELLREKLQYYLEGYVEGEFFLLGKHSFEGPEATVSAQIVAERVKSLVEGEDSASSVVESVTAEYSIASKEIVHHSGKISLGSPSSKAAPLLASLLKSLTQIDGVEILEDSSFLLVVKASNMRPSQVGSFGGWLKTEVAKVTSIFGFIPKAYAQGCATGSCKSSCTPNEASCGAVGCPSGQTYCYTPAAVHVFTKYGGSAVNGVTIELTTIGGTCSIDNYKTGVTRSPYGHVLFAWNQSPYYLWDLVNTVTDCCADTHRIRATGFPSGYSCGSGARYEVYGTGSVKLWEGWGCDIYDPSGNLFDNTDLRNVYFYLTYDGGGNGCTEYKAGKPTGLTASNVDTDSADLSWTNGSDGECCPNTTTNWGQQYRKVGGNWTILDWSTQKPRLLTGLESDTTYEWQVAQGHGCQPSAGDWSSIHSFKTLSSGGCDPPAAPDKPTISVSGITSSSAQLDWSSGDANCDPCTPCCLDPQEFRARFKKKGTSTFTVLPWGPSLGWSISRLESDTLYEWGVNQRNGCDITSGFETGEFTTSSPTTCTISGGGGWQNRDFSVFIDDSDCLARNSSLRHFCWLTSVEYLHSTAGWVLSGSGVDRTCSSNATITVGPAGYCRSEGANKCQLRTARCRDELGLPNFDCGPEYFNIDWTPPTASLVPSSITIYPGQSVTFTVDASDALSGVNTWRLNCDDTWPAEHIGTGDPNGLRRTCSTYPSAGTYTARLRIRDHANNLGVATATIKVINPPPTNMGVSLHATSTGYPTTNTVYSNGKTGYYIEQISSNVAGVNDIIDMRSGINRLSGNYLDYRGLFRWVKTSDKLNSSFWAQKFACSGGGWAGKYTGTSNNGYGKDYVDLYGCQSFTSGNRRTVRYYFHANPNYTTPLGWANDIATRVNNSSGGSGWRNYDLNFRAGQCFGPSDACCNASLQTLRPSGTDCSWDGSTVCIRCDGSGNCTGAVNTCGNRNCDCGETTKTCPRDCNSSPQALWVSPNAGSSENTVDGARNPQWFTTAFTDPDGIDDLYYLVFYIDRPFNESLMSGESFYGMVWPNRYGGRFYYRGNGGTISSLGSDDNTYNKLLDGASLYFYDVGQLWVQWQIQFKPTWVEEVDLWVAALDRLGATSGWRRMGNYSIRAPVDDCTEGECCDTSTKTFKPAGTPCVADGNVCKDYTCNGASNLCTDFTTNTVSCDDGLYCNGTDTCSGGICVHSGACSLDCGCDEVNDVCIPCNQAPIAIPQTVSVEYDVRKIINLGARDDDGDNLRFDIVTPPSDGALYRYATGTTPAVGAKGGIGPITECGSVASPDYTCSIYYESTSEGEDNFTFKVNDGQVDSATAATVTLNVNMSSWFQVQGAGLYGGCTTPSCGASGAIQATIPDGKFLVTSGDSTGDAAIVAASSAGVVVGGGGVGTDRIVKDYSEGVAWSAPNYRRLNSLSSGHLISNPQAKATWTKGDLDPSNVYWLSAGAQLPASATTYNLDGTEGVLIIYVDSGGLTFNGNFISTDLSKEGIIFVVKDGNVTIGENVTRIDAIIVTGRDIIINDKTGVDSQLTINGSLLAQGWVNLGGRSLSDNADPVIKVIYNPFYLTQASFITRSMYSWVEE